MKRRAYLGVAAAATLAGCSGFGGTNSSAADDPEPIEEEAGDFDDFEDLSAWEAIEGRMEADTDRAVNGSQSVRIEPEEGYDRVMIKREFDTPRDLSDELPGLAVMASDRIDVVCQLSDIDEDRLLMRTTARGGGPFVHHNFGVVDVDGWMDTSTVAHVKISAWVGEDRSLSVWLDDLHFVSRPETGTVLLGVEGSDASLVSEVRSAVEARGLSATVFADSSRVGGSGHVDVSELESLVDAGWSVGVRGRTGADLTEMHDGQLGAQLSSAAEWLDEHGFDDEAAALAYPLGRYDERVLDLAADHYDYAFTTSHPVHGHVRNSHLCPRALDPDRREASRLLDLAAEHRGIVTLSYSDEGLDALGPTLDAIERHVDAGDLVMGTPADLGPTGESAQVDVEDAGDDRNGAGNESN